MNEATNQTDDNLHEDLTVKEEAKGPDAELKEAAEEILNEQTDKNAGAQDSAAKLQAELTEVQDKYLRLFAEFDNYKRRTIKERSDLLKTANQETLLAMLPVLDDFERAQKSFGNDVPEAVKTGIELVFQKLKSTLTQKGLKEMESTGKDFDSEFHEAITKIPAPSEEMKGKVFDTLEKGYFLNEKVIRFAKVVVGE
ncbi:MAG: nucleotide exchange factor GrpE [Bacteroidetes bacterium]|nr:nucleotide exchange factor GrpE [Bacteroidota bacterium]